MLQLDAFNGKELQHFIAVLNILESEGVTEIRYARQRIHEAMAGIARRHNRGVKKYHNRVKYRKQFGGVLPKKGRYKRCPSCGRGVLVGPYDVEGLGIIRCALKCGYSEVVQ